MGLVPEIKYFVSCILLHSLVIHLLFVMTLLKNKASFPFVFSEVDVRL